MSKDDIFKKETLKSSFSFNDEVAQVFDDMTKRSIINYEETTEITAQVACHFAQKNSKIYDLGCSTGNTLLAIAQSLSDKNTQIIGYDLSEAMIKKCQQKLNSFNFGGRVSISQQNCLDAPLNNASIIIMNYTLQFVNQENRLALLQRIYNNLNTDGAFVLSEKVHEDDEVLTQFNTKKYYQLKELNGYSKLEIANKRNALEEVLKPHSYWGNYQLLQDAGFTKVMTLFKYLNFTTYLAIK